MEKTMRDAIISASMGTEGVAPPGTLASGEVLKTVVVAGKRVEIDTSAPFESVKEAVDRFGGSAVWKSQLKQLLYPGKHHSIEEFELLSFQEQTARMKKDIIAKEQETIEILMELERIKRIGDSLKSRLHEESSKVNKFSETFSDNVKLHSAVDHKGEIVRLDSLQAVMHVMPSPGSILVELKQAKMNLGMTTSNLADIRASIESVSIKKKKEKALHKKTFQKLSARRADVSSLEEELKHITLRLQLTTEAKDICNQNSAGTSMEFNHFLTIEREQFIHATEAAKSEILRLTLEIEQTKATIKATEIRLLSVKKMEEESKAAEAVALAQTNALINCISSTVCLQNNSMVVLSVEEYAKLTQKVQEADESSRNTIEAALLEVETANQSKLVLIAKIEETAENLKTRRKVLEQALNRVETANTGMQAVQETLRRWRSEHGHRRRHICNSNFKNSYPGHHKRDSRMLDRDELNLVTDDPRIGLKDILSIGEILSRKLLGPDDYNIGISFRSNDKATVSLGQIISRRSAVFFQNDAGSVLKQHPRKRKKFVFVGFSRVLMNDRMKGKYTKRKQISGSR